MGSLWVDSLFLYLQGFMLQLYCIINIKRIGTISGEFEAVEIWFLWVQKKFYELAKMLFNYWSEAPMSGLISKSFRGVKMRV